MSKNEQHPASWWEHRRDQLLDLARDRSPCYVYHVPSLETSAETVRSTPGIRRVFYAVKANPHPEILRVLERNGLGFECVSPGELDRVFDVLPGLDPDRVLFQPNFAAIGEYADAIERGVHVTIDNVALLRRSPNVFAGQDLFVRVDPGEGYGHHRKVQTAGPRSKFGIAPEDLPAVREAADRVDATIVGLHAHLGSGITDEQTWADLVEDLAGLADDCPGVEVLNLGGGLGVPPHSTGERLDVDTLHRALTAAARRWEQYRLWMEPGRFLVADAGILLARVTQTKTKGDTRFVGLETGMNSLLRPALYGARHEIVNLSRLDEPPAMRADVVGPICESGDVLRRDCALPDTEPGDVLLVDTVGAYGATMANRYNLRPPAEEIVLSGDE